MYASLIDSGAQLAKSKLGTTAETMPFKAYFETSKSTALLDALKGLKHIGVKGYLRCARRGACPRARFPSEGLCHLLPNGSAAPALDIIMLPFVGA